MEPSLLSVIELGALPDGNLSVSTSVRTVAEFDRPPVAPSLTCLFEEPADATIRLRIGAAQLDAMVEPGFIDEAAVGPGIWPGCLPRLSHAGRALKPQDVDALLATRAHTESIWFEVGPWVGSWRAVDAQRVRETLADLTLNPRAKPFFVQAAGNRSAVRDMLLALRTGSADETPGA